MKIFSKQNLGITIISDSNEGSDLSNVLEEINIQLRNKKSNTKYQDYLNSILKFNSNNSKEILTDVLFYNFKELDVHYVNTLSLAKRFDKYTDVLLQTDIILLYLDKSIYKYTENIFNKIRSLKDNESRCFNLVYPRSCELSYKEIGKYINSIDSIIGYSSQEELILQLSFIVKNKLNTDNLKNINSRLKQLSNTDELTGLYNMRAFWNLYAGNMIECKKGEGSYSIFMVDIDNFKQVNDRYDHLIGSNILAEIGSMFLRSSSISSSDYVARYGGDEYIIVKNNTSYKDMMSFAKELVDMFSEHKFEYKPYTISITISLGCVLVESGFNGCDEDPIKLADLLLYKSKITGKNTFFGMDLKNNDNISLKMTNVLEDIKNLRSSKHINDEFKESDIMEDKIQYSLDLDSMIYKCEHDKNNEGNEYNKDNNSNNNNDNDNDEEQVSNFKKIS